MIPQPLNLALKPCTLRPPSTLTIDRTGVSERATQTAAARALSHNRTLFSQFEATQKAAQSADHAESGGQGGEGVESDIMDGGKGAENRKGNGTKGGGKAAGDGDTLREQRRTGSEFRGMTRSQRWRVSEGRRVDAEVREAQVRLARRDEEERQVRNKVNLGTKKKKQWKLILNEYC